MKIAIIGSGYVGLVSGACLAEWGHQVVCVDSNAAKVAGLQRGVVPIYEPGLEDLIARNRDLDRLSFTVDLQAALSRVDAVFIAVGTPPRANGGDADLSFVFQAARQIGERLQGHAVVVVKSTVPPGTGAAVERILREVRPHRDFAVVSNPEFLREGSAIKDFLHPDRVVIGSEDESASRIMLDIYAPVQELGAPIVVTMRKTSELIKYAANAFLATKISFINEMADLCERIEADVRELAVGMGLDHRIGQSFLNAGPGYGGSCFPKDTLALLRAAQDYGVSLRLVEETVAVNNARKRKMAMKVCDAVGGSVEGLTIAVLGLSFKPNTDDMREAPSIPLIEALQRAGARIHAHDPVGMKEASEVLEDVDFFDDPYRCVRDADAVVIVTDWDCFKTLDLSRLRSEMAGDTVVDLRNIIPAAEAQRNGLKLSGLGTAPLPVSPSVDETPAPPRAAAAMAQPVLRR